jgi:hypothetical protein
MRLQNLPALALWVTRLIIISSILVGGTRSINAESDQYELGSLTFQMPVGSHKVQVLPVGTESVSRSIDLEGVPLLVLQDHSGRFLCVEHSEKKSTVIDILDLHKGVVARSFTFDLETLRIELDKTRSHLLVYDLGEYNFRRTKARREARVSVIDIALQKMITKGFGDVADFMIYNAEYNNILISKTEAKKYAGNNNYVELHRDEQRLMVVEVEDPEHSYLIVPNGKVRGAFFTDGGRLLAVLSRDMGKNGKKEADTGQLDFYDQNGTLVRSSKPMNKPLMSYVLPNGSAWICFPSYMQFVGSDGSVTDRKIDGSSTGTAFFPDEKLLVMLVSDLDAKGKLTKWGRVIITNQSGEVVRTSQPLTEPIRLLPIAGHRGVWIVFSKAVQYVGANGEISVAAISSEKEIRPWDAFAIDDHHVAAVLTKTCKDRVGGLLYTCSGPGEPQHEAALFDIASGKLKAVVTTGDSSVRAGRATLGAILTLGTSLMTPEPRPNVPYQFVSVPGFFSHHFLGRMSRSYLLNSSRDARTLYALDAASDQLTAANIDDGQVVQNIPVHRHAYRLWRPKGSDLLYSLADEYVDVIDTRSNRTLTTIETRQKLILTDDDGAFICAFSADGLEVWDALKAERKQLLGASEWKGCSTQLLSLIDGDSEGELP